MYKVYTMELQFRDKIYGGVPKNPEVLNTFLQIQGMPEELSEEYEEEADLDAQAEKYWTGFRKDETGIFIRDFQIKAMLKETASVLGITTQKRGSKAILQHGLFIKPPRIHLLDEQGNPKKEPDGYDDIVGSPKGPGGRRSIIRRVDYALRPRIRFRVYLLDGGKLSEEDLRKCFELGQEDGLGSLRSYEAGKFDIVKFEREDS